MVHAQQRALTAAAPTEVVAIAAGQGVRAVTPVTASAVVSTTLSPVQSQTRPMVTQVTPGTSDIKSLKCFKMLLFRSVYSAITLQPTVRMEEAKYFHSEIWEVQTY